MKTNLTQPTDSNSRTEDFRQEVAQLYKQHAGLLWRVFFARCHDPALSSDALQESFRKLLMTAPGAIRQPLSWLRLVGKNYIIDQARRASAKFGSEKIPELVDSDETEPWMSCSVRERRNRVKDALGELSEKDRQVLVLRYMHHQSSRQIGQATGKSQSAVDMWLCRARQRLAIALQSV